MKPWTRVNGHMRLILASAYKGVLTDRDQGCNRAILRGLLDRRLLQPDLIHLTAAGEKMHWLLRGFTYAT